MARRNLNVLSREPFGTWFPPCRETATVHVMVDGTGWAGIGVSLAGGFSVGSVIGPVINTYGGKGQTRRKVRSRALNSLEKLEIRRRSELASNVSYDRGRFTALCARCMIAGVPRYVVSVYDHICLAFGGQPDPDAQPPGGLAEEAALLLRDTLWHPQGSRATRRRRARQLDNAAASALGARYKPVFETTRSASRSASSPLSEPGLSPPDSAV